MENSELLERFLPGYRLVCRVAARQLGIDLTMIMTVLFVVFALLKSAQYVWTSAASVLCLWFTSSISVSSRDRLHDDVLRWVSTFAVDGGDGDGDGPSKDGSSPLLSMVMAMATARALSVVPDREEEEADDGGEGNDDDDGVEVEPVLNGLQGPGKSKSTTSKTVLPPHPSSASSSPLRYEPALGSTIWFFHGWRVVFLERRPARMGELTSRGDTLVLTCVGLTTEPLRSFLDECLEYAAAGGGGGHTANGWSLKKLRRRRRLHDKGGKES